MKVKMFTDGFEGYRKRSLSRAKKLDKGEKIEESITLTFADPADMLSVLTKERIRLFHALNKKPDLSVTSLAEELKRDTKAVRRDIAKLEQWGIVRTELQTNPGHGSIRVVIPVAKSISLQATL